MFRDMLGALFIKLGMAIIRPDTRDMVRAIILYHVPGGLTEAEKAKVEAAKTEYLRDWEK